MDENRLKAMLAGSKAVMDKVETGNYQKGHIDQSKLIDSEQLIESAPGGHMGNYNEQVYEEREYIPTMPKQTYRNLNTTKMPKEIVEAMIQTPINVPDSPYFSFEVSDDMINEINPGNRKKVNTTTNAPQRLAETKRAAITQGIGLTENEVRDIVREEMEQIIYEYFDKRVIKEDIQIKVGSTIFSGTLSPLPGKKSTKKR